jgi:hypothetical protein
MVADNFIRSSHKLVNLKLLLKFTIFHFSLNAKKSFDELHFHCDDKKIFKTHPKNQTAPCGAAEV